MTSTVWAVAVGVTMMLTPDCCPVRICTFVVDDFNPVADAVSSYGSGLRNGAVKRPSAFVTRFTVAPVNVSLTVIVAFGTAAPDGSVTNPLMDPVVAVCADRDNGESN